MNFIKKRQSAKKNNNDLYNKKNDPIGHPFISGRSDKVRTCDLYVPNVALYQAELHSVKQRTQLCNDYK